MLTSDVLPVAGYVLLGVVGWILLMVTFLAVHAPGKTTTELIREAR